MNTNLYVGNLAVHTSDSDLTREFSRYGPVVRAWIVTNPDTSESRGFGYVEMSEGGDQAVAGLDGTLYQGRSLTVRQTKPRVVPAWPDEDHRERIPVMPDYQFRGWPLPIIEEPRGDARSWAGLYDAFPELRDPEAYSASQIEERSADPAAYGNVSG